LFGQQSGDPSEDPRLLVTRRTEHLEKHKGQMAFPGGAQEEGESVVDAALRETEEEVGISRDRIRVLGQLPELWTVTDFWITPVVGVLLSPVDETPILSSIHEIAETFWVPLSKLRDTETYRKEWVDYKAVRYPVHAYYVESSQGMNRIWGATGAMIQNLLERFEKTS
jgi:8-oxo-dGTP pyrophosphatase MutT (NUDIX family)